jgi:hypothetical protein
LREVSLQALEDRAVREAVDEKQGAAVCNRRRFGWAVVNRRSLMLKLTGVP